MAQSVTANFLAAQKADNASYAWKVQLVLGDYANGNGKIGGATPTAVASSTDGSGNYPASGAINGDRTELNVGAASGADNGVGQASWRSSTAPDTTPQTLEVDFNTTRTFTRVKVYNLDTHGLKSYTVEYWDGAAWQVAATKTGGGSAGRVDTFDFAAVSATKMRLNISHTAVAADMANVVEVEVYRLVDISSRVISVRTSRQRDFKLKNPLAASAEVTVDNTDQFFSLAYTPTAAQTTAGYVNSELRSNMGLIVKNGFNHAGGTELVATFTGKVDSVTDRAKARTAVIRGRDGTKALINQQVSTKLKTSYRIDLAVQYLLNLANVSNYEMSLQTVNLTLPYFFVYQTTVLTAVQQLAQASVFQTFYFDENGIAQFQSAANTKTVFATADWQAGTVLTNIDSVGTANAIQRGWYKIDDFADGDYTTNPTWTVVANNGSASVAASTLTINSNVATKHTTLSTPLLEGTGTWAWTSSVSFATLGDEAFVYFFLTKNDPTASGVTGYCLAWYYSGSTPTVALLKITGPLTNVTLGSSQVSGNFNSHNWVVGRDASGNFKVYMDGSQVITATDNSYSTGSYFVVDALAGTAGSATLNITSIYWSADTNRTSAVTNVQAVYESAVFDQGTSLTAEGVLTAVYDATAAGTSLTFYTATSADNVTWEAYKAVTPGQAIPSTTNRYIKFKVVLAAPEDDGLHNAILFTPVVYQVTLSWLTSGNLALRYDSTVIDVEYAQADDLGGDTRIYNDLTVSGAPLVLSGNSTDTQWQGTAGSTPAAISASNPLTVNAGTITIQATIPGGMDTSNMAGGSAIAITWGTATGTASISYVHPTLPIIKLVVTAPGTITDLRLIGKAFGAATTQIQANVKDTGSIAIYDDRAQNINNTYIVSYSQAVVIATNFVSKYASPATYIPKLDNLPLYSAQLGDAATVTETNTGLATAMTIVGIDSQLAASGRGATARSMLKLLT